MPRPLVIACGALVSELRAVLAADGLDQQVEVRYLPANLHNRPERIVPELIELLAEHDPRGERPVLVGYGDCGTGGALDRLIEQRPNLRRFAGNHCYEFYTGTSAFTAMADDEVGTFFLTDFLAKHFEALIWQGLGLDRHPQLLPMYFGNYTRLALISQSADEKVVTAAQEAAERLGLRFEHRHVGLAPFSEAVTVALRPIVRPDTTEPDVRGAA